MALRGYVNHRLYRWRWSCKSPPESLWRSVSPFGGALETHSPSFQLSDATKILRGLAQGQLNTAEQLLELVYSELRQMAGAKMAREAPGQTLQPTALVHEAFLRLAGPDRTLQFENRAHFFAAAAEAMRRILVDNARRKRAAKHGGSLQRLDWNNLQVASPEDDQMVLAVDEALEKLGQHDPIGAQLIELRFFTGLSNLDASKVLGLSERTAKRTWAYARAWLMDELRQTS
jgi:RNA polymerase sigma factor (TIGR02999 family)